MNRDALTRLIDERIQHAIDQLDGGPLTFDWVPWPQWLRRDKETDQ